MPDRFLRKVLIFFAGIGIVIECIVALVFCQGSECERNGRTMINFEKELSTYQPSLEVDEAEEAIYNNDLTDISDILDKILKDKKNQ